MKKLLEFSESPVYVKEYLNVIFDRISNNVKMLSIDFLLTMVDKVKSKDWSKSNCMCLVTNILLHSLPHHREALRNHFSGKFSKERSLTSVSAICGPGTCWKYITTD